MRNGQNNNKRMRNNNNNRNNHSHSSNNNNNNNRRGQNPMTRVYESNGPEIKIRGTASHLAEKYVQLARDAQGSGDPVSAENFYQHAEHYFRIIAAAQEQFRQNQPQQQPRLDNDTRDENGDEDNNDYSSFGAEPGFAPQPQQQPSFQPREPSQQREHSQHREPSQQREQQPREYRENRQFQPQPQPVVQPSVDDVDRLPSFITGGQPQPTVAAGAFENGGDRPAGERTDRFPHRRRRRPHAARPDNAGAAPATADDFGPGSAGE
jgi:hypothetical protein